MKRSRAIGFLGALICLTFAGLAFGVDRPNIIYIMLDDAGYGDLSCQGQTKFKTPNINRLAIEGMRFTTPPCACRKNTPRHLAKSLRKRSANTEGRKSRIGLSRSPA
jgi:hypothetical protein